MVIEQFFTDDALKAKLNLVLETWRFNTQARIKLLRHTDRLCKPYSTVSAALVSAHHFPQIPQIRALETRVEPGLCCNSLLKQLRRILMVCLMQSCDP